MYYNQYNFAHTTYPSPTLPKATVASGGCGVVCASMVIEILTKKSFPPEKSAPFSISIGARVIGGTDMLKLGRGISKEFGLDFTTTNDVNMLKSHMQKGGLAIVNVSGDRAGYTGLFSNSGHFITCIRTDKTHFAIYDPGYWQGKFNQPGRTGKVTINGNEIYVRHNVLDLDCIGRNPRYYLFAKAGEEKDMALIKTIMQRTGKSEEEVIEALSVLIQFANVKEGEWEKEGVQKLMQMRLINTHRDGREMVEFGELGLILDRFKKMM